MTERCSRAVGRGAPVLERRILDPRYLDTDHRDSRKVDRGSSRRIMLMREPANNQNDHRRHTLSADGCAAPKNQKQEDGSKGKSRSAR